MKLFEKRWPEQDERVFDLTEDKECCAVTWRAAYESIKRKIRFGDDATSILEVVAFIDEELNE